MSFAHFLLYFSCINICRGMRKLFEPEAARGGMAGGCELCSLFAIFFMH